MQTLTYSVIQPPHAWANIVGSVDSVPALRIWVLVVLLNTLDHELQSPIFGSGQYVMAGVSANEPGPSRSQKQ